MNLLLDTHVVIWWLANDDLDDEVLARIADPDAIVAVSAASIWEAAIKQVLGKLSLPEPLSLASADEGFEPLLVTFEHAERSGELPPHHRDPFDRLLVAQAQMEDLTLVSRDPAFALYDVPTLAC